MKVCQNCGLAHEETILELANGGYHPLNRILWAQGRYWGPDVLCIAIGDDGLCQRCREDARKEPVSVGDLLVWGKA